MMGKRKRNLQGKVITAISLVVSTLVVVIPCVFDKLYYMIADDYLMNLIAQGSYGIKNSPFLIFVSSLLGYPMKVCYTFLPDINWYAIFQLGTLILAFGIINISLLSSSTRSLGILIVTGLLEMIAVYHLTFTVIAYLCTGAGCVYLLCRTWKNKKIKWKDISIFTFFLLLGDSWRSSTIITALAVFAVLLIYAVWKNKRLLVCFLIAICAIGVSRSIDDFLYRKDNLVWEDYKEYNRMRSNVVDFPRLDYEEYKAKYQEIGLSENDVKCLYRWIFADKEVYSGERLNALSEMQPITQKYNWNILKIISSMFQLKYNYWYLAIVLLAILMTEKRAWWMSFLIPLSTYALIAALFFRGRVVLRVLIPVYLLGILAVLVWMILNKKEMHNTKAKNQFICGIQIIVFCIGAICLLRGNQITELENKRQNQKYDAMKDFIVENPQYLYVGSSSIINPLEYSTDIFSVGKDIEVNGIVKLGSWDIYSTRYYEQLERFNIQNQNSLLCALLEKNVRYMVGDQTELELIITYLKEHVEKNIEYNIIKEFLDSEVKIIEFVYSKN